MARFGTGLLGSLVISTIALAGCSSGSEPSAGSSSSPPASSASGSPSSAASSATVPAPRPGQFTVKQFNSNSAQGWSATNQVLSSPKGNILIDPGSYDSDVASYISSIGGVSAIMITHGHWDKLRGLDAAMKANPKAIAYINRLDQPYLKDPVRNASIEDGFRGTTDAKTVALSDGTRTIAGHRVRIIHLPGHTEGSSIFYFPDDNLLIGGDTIMPDKVGSANHPRGNQEQRQASIRRFRSLTFSSGTRVYSGHGEQTTYGQLMRTNTDLK